MTTRLIFLDLDGCLNSDSWYDGFLSRGEPIPRPPIDRAAVARLERIVQATGAHIVLSTSWRGDPRLPLWLLHHGCSAAVVGRTPRLPGAGERVNATRGIEIASWLRRRARCGVAIRGFCILDDGDDFGALAPWLVQTTPAAGLQDEHVGRAIALLGGR